MTHRQEMSIMGNPKGLEDHEAVVSFDTEYTADKVVSMQLVLQCNGFTEEYYEVVNAPKIEPKHLLKVIKTILPDRITDVHLFSHYNKAEVSTLKISKLNMFIAAASMYNYGLDFEITDKLFKASGYKPPVNGAQLKLYEKYGYEYIPARERVRKYIAKKLKEQGVEFDTGGTEDYDVYKNMKFEPKKFKVEDVEVTYEQKVHHRKHVTIHKEMIFDTLFEGQTVHWKSTKLFMNSSLKSIGETMKIPKLHLTEKEYIKIDSLDPEKLKQYGMRDVYISQALVNGMGRNMIENLTLSGIVKKDFSAQFEGPDSKFSSRDGEGKYNYVVETKADEIRKNLIHQESYFGGHNETPVPCVLGDKWWAIDLDMTSAYSKGQLKIRAYWSEVKVVNLSKLTRRGKESFMNLIKGMDPLNGYQMGTVTIKDLVLKKGSKYSIPTKIIDSTVWMKYKRSGALSLAWLYTLIKSKSIDWSETKLISLTYYECSGPLLFWDQIQGYIEKRKGFEKGTLGNTDFKLRRNAMYGLVGQSGMKKGSKSWLLQGYSGEEKGIMGPFYHPVMASYITSVVQILLQEQYHHTLETIEGSIHLNSVTDGFAYAHRGDEPIVITDHYGMAGDIMEVGAMWEPKHISKGVINIKTRYSIFMGKETVEGEHGKVTLPSSTIKPYLSDFVKIDDNGVETFNEKDYWKAIIKATQDTSSIQRRMHTERQIVQEGEILNQNEIIFSVNHNIDAKYMVIGYEVLDENSIKLITKRVSSVLDYTNIKTYLDKNHNTWTMPIYGTNFYEETEWREKIQKMVDNTETITYKRKRRILLKITAEFFHLIETKEFQTGLGKTKTTHLPNTTKMKLMRKVHEKMFKGEDIVKKRFTKKWIKEQRAKEIDGEFSKEVIELTKGVKKYLTRTINDQIKSINKETIKSFITKNTKK